MMSERKKEGKKIILLSHNFLYLLLLLDGTAKVVEELSDRSFILFGRFTVG